MNKRLSILLLYLAPTLLGAQTRHEIIRGRITTDSGRAVASAAVTAQRAPDRAQKSAQTDASGLYSIDWPDGTGEYLVTVRASGLPTLSRRLTRAGTDTVLVFDALLTNAPRVQRLPATVSQAQRPSPTRQDDPDVGATSGFANNYRRIAPDLAGDLTALTALVPGVMSTPAGNSSFMSASTVCVVGSRMSSSRLCVRISNCSRDFLSTCGERRTV